MTTQPLILGGSRDLWFAVISEIGNVVILCPSQTLHPEFTMNSESHVLHAGGGVHGGIYCLLLDSACWFAAAVHFPTGTWLSTADLNVHFLRACGPGRRLRCVGRVLKLGSRTSVCVAELYDDSSGSLLAYATGSMAMVSSIPRFNDNEQTKRSTVQVLAKL